MSHTAEVPDLDFLDLIDVPDDYAGDVDYIVVVKGDRSGLQFVAAVNTDSIGGVPVSFPPDPTDNQILVYDETEEAFVAQDQGLASGSILDTTDFDNILSPTEDTVQKALDVLDDHSHGGAGIYSGAKMYLTANITIPSIINVLIPWGADQWDTDSYWAIGDPTKIVIPVTGKYRFTVNMVWVVIDKDVFTECSLYKNGVRMLGSQSGLVYGKLKQGYQPPFNQLTFESEFTAGDYVECNIYVDIESYVSNDIQGDADPNDAGWISVERMD